MAAVLPLAAGGPAAVGAAAALLEAVARGAAQGAAARHAAGAMVSACARVLLGPPLSAGAVSVAADEHGEELNARWEAIRPVLAARIRAGAAGVRPEIDGGALARRNLGEHACHGQGPGIVQCSGAEAKRRQRAGRARRRRAEGTAKDGLPGDEDVSSTAPSRSGEGTSAADADTVTLLEKLDTVVNAKADQIADTETLLGKLGTVANAEADQIADTEKLLVKLDPVVNAEANQIVDSETLDTRDTAKAVLNKYHETIMKESKDAEQPLVCGTVVNCEVNPTLEQLMMQVLLERPVDPVPVMIKWLANHVPEDSSFEMMDKVLENEESKDQLIEEEE